MRKWIIGIFIFILITVISPLLIDWFVFANNFPSNISNEAWAGFLGSYIGGVCTMGAVFITITYNNKKLKEQQEQQEAHEKEQKRLNIRPYLDTRHTYFDHNITIGPHDRVFELDIENEDAQKLYFGINDTKRKKIELSLRHKPPKDAYINYIIRNVGAGNAVDMTISVNNFKERLAIAKNETIQILCIISIVDTFDLKIKLDFSDVESRGRYSKEEIIHIEVKPDVLESKMIQRDEQKLIM